MSSETRSGLLLAVAAALLGASLLGPPGISSGPPTWGILVGGIGGVLAGCLLAAGYALSREQALGLGLFALWLGWSTLSAGSSLDPFRSSVALGIYSATLALTTLLALTANSHQGPRPAAHLMVLTALGTSLYGLATAPRFPFKANFTNPDCYSVLPLVGVMLTLGLLQRARSAELYYLVFSLFCLGLTAVLTGSRAGLLGMLAGVVVFAWRAVPRGKRGILLAATVVPVLLGLLVFGGGALQKWRNLLGGQEIGLKSRLDVLRYGVLTALEKPLLGTGPGTFALAYQSQRPAERNGEYMNAAHNDYIQLLVESGAVGLLLWLGLLFGSLRLGRRQPGAAAAVAGVGVYALGNFALPVLVDGLFWTGSLALCWPVGPPAPRLARLTLGILVGLAGLGGVLVGSRLVKADTALARAQQFAELLEWERAREELAGVEDPRAVLAHTLALERLGQFTDDGSLLELARRELTQALERSPRDLHIMLRLARLLQTQRNYAEAQVILLEAGRQARHSESIRLELARNLILQGRFQEAARALIDLAEQGNPNALGELLALLEQEQAGQGLTLLRGATHFPAGATRYGAQVLQKLGNLDGAQRFLELARQADPDDFETAQALLALKPDPGLMERMLEAPGLTSEQKVEVARQWAQGKLQAHQPTAVVERLGPMVNGQPGLRVLLSQAYIDLNRLPEALGVLNAALDEDTDGSLHLALASLQERLGDLEGAIQSLQEARRWRPEDAALSTNLERLRQRMQEPSPESRSP